MDAQFEAALAAVLQDEGGYVNDPVDPGEETFRGVSRHHWPNWIGWPMIDAAKAAGCVSPKAIDAKFKGDEKMATAVARFYEEKFWWPVLRYGFPERTTAKLFNARVNMGFHAIEVLQRVVGVLPDGKCGPKTIAATKEFIKLRGEGFFLGQYCREQLRYYRGCKNWPRYKGGWTRRAAWMPSEAKR